jgi:SAM-dependent methyltransferase
MNPLTTMAFAGLPKGYGQILVAVGSLLVSTAAMPAFDPATLAFYAREAPDYAASGPGGVGRHLEGFLERLAPGALILELGCGSGRDAASMEARGFRVDPTDGVPASISSMRW